MEESRIDTVFWLGCLVDGGTHLLRWGSRSRDYRLKGELVHFWTCCV